MTWTVDGPAAAAFLMRMRAAGVGPKEPGDE